MAVLNRCFHVVDQFKFDANDPKVLPLSREVANELVLLSVLMPLALSDLGADYYPKVFATDASTDKGGICWADLPQEVLQTLWRSCRSKGSYTRVLSPAEQVLRNNGMFDEEKLNKQECTSVERPFAYEFDFLEIFSGASLSTIVPD